MSEPVYHNLCINGPNADDATTATFARLDQLDRRWDLTRSSNKITFTTPWEPQVILVLDMSLEFPDCDFILGFFGSVGTALEDSTEFYIQNGSIHRGKVYLSYEDDPRRVITDVLEYCGMYVDAPIMKVTTLPQHFKHFNFEAEHTRATDTAARLKAATSNMMVFPKMSHPPFQH